MVDDIFNYNLADNYFGNNQEARIDFILHSSALYVRIISKFTTKADLKKNYIQAIANFINAPNQKNEFRFAVLGIHNDGEYFTFNKNFRRHIFKPETVPAYKLLCGIVMNNKT